MLSEKYWEITLVMGTMLNKALMGMGSNAVTVRSTGRETHQNTIHANVPTASAPGPVRASAKANAQTANSTGPMMR